MLTLVIFVFEFSPCRSDNYNGNLIQVLGNEYSVPEEGCVSSCPTREFAALTADGALNKSDGLIVEKDANNLEGKKTAFEEIVTPKHESTISKDVGAAAGEVQKSYFRYKLYFVDFCLGVFTL